MARRIVFTLGDQEVYDPLIEAYGLKKGGRGWDASGEDSEGGTVWRELQQAVLVQQHPRNINRFAIYLVEISDESDVLWAPSGRGELLKDSPIVAKLCP